MKEYNFPMANCVKNWFLLNKKKVLLYQRRATGSVANQSKLENVDPKTIEFIKKKLEMAQTFQTAQNWFTAECAIFKQKIEFAIIENFKNNKILLMF